MKTPNYKDLGLNFKQVLRKANLDTWKDVKKKYNKLFCMKLIKWMKRNDIPQSCFNPLYKKLFYFGFVSYKQERKLKEYLESSGWFVKYASLANDVFNGVDLTAQKQGSQIYLQVKSSLNNVKEEHIKLLKRISSYHNKEAYFVVINSNSINFYDLNLNKISFKL